MDYVYLSVMGSLIGTVSIILIYIYLYILYRERCMGVWTISWLILLSRFALFDSKLIPWKQSALGVTTYEILTILSSLLFAWGTHLFINKPFNIWWLYGTISVSIISATLNFLNPFMAYKLLLPIFICCLVGIWIGLTFIRHLKLRGIGRLITGYAFILWSILSLALPFTIEGWWSLPWAYSLGGILRLIIAIGTLMVYFEKTRVDLVNKETQYRLLAENAADIIFHYQLLPEAKIRYISPSALPLTGYNPEEYYADNHLVFSLIHPDDHCLLDAFFDTLPRSIESPLTLRLVRKDETILWIEQKCVPIYDQKGNFTALQGIIRDVTAQKKVERMASMLDRVNMVGSMAATVAHEIRNPITTVRGYLQVLGRKEQYQTDKEKFKLMIEEIDRANGIIREYLSLSREKASDFKKCSLNNIIQALFPLIQADANSSKVYVNLDLTDIPQLLLDENEIRQLLLNLVRNSIEAMSSGGDLLIRTFLEDSNAVLSVTDQGSGIPSHILDHLGTPFITTKDTGTGLGLPICYQIVHKHNANIKINTSIKGTTFFIYFSPSTP